VVRDEVLIYESWCSGHSGVGLGGLFEILHTPTETELIGIGGWTDGCLEILHSLGASFCPWLVIDRYEFSL
jgi:hypothetical protein